jgi:hypothetical protein
MRLWRHNTICSGKSGDMLKKTHCFLCNLYNNGIIYKIKKVVRTVLFGTTWLEFKDMAQDPLVSREPASASCNRRPDEVVETQKYSLYTKEHPANFPLRWRLSNGLGVYLKTRYSTLGIEKTRPRYVVENRGIC